MSILVLSACAHHPSLTPSANNSAVLSSSIDTTTLSLSEAKFGLAAVNDGSFIYVLGGSSQRGLSGDIEIIDLQTNEVSILSNKIIPRRYFSAVFDGRESVYIIGGLSVKNKRPRREFQVEVFNTRTHEVSFIERLKVPTRTNTAVFHDNNIYVLGGSILTPAGTLATPWTFMFSIESQQWSKLADMPTAKSTKAIVKDNYIYVVGGYDEKSAMQVFERFDISNQQWETLPSLPKGISAHSLVSIEDRIFTFGNYDDLNDVFVYDYLTESWQAADFGYLPSRHNAATAVGNDIYVIGGTVKSRGGALKLIQKLSVQ
ncbi:Kelch repeat-containing protein [Glaciecola sp. SC05]|uniref:Kelch repeat-containing protein n=1 Tax=Glaciecola sp. SC05 TaxID=1987355 RepID=UPI0035271458